MKKYKSLIIGILTSISSLNVNAQFYITPTITTKVPALGSMTANIGNIVPLKANNNIFFGPVKTTYTGPDKDGLYSVLVPVGASYGEFITSALGLTVSDPITFNAVLPSTGNIATTSFSERTDISLDFTPTAVTKGDFDENGTIDLAFTCSIDSSVYIFSNLNSSGKIESNKFVQVARLKTGLSPNAIESADIDADGKLDLVVVNSGSGTGSVSIFKNITRKGYLNQTSFATKVDFNVGQTPKSLAIADINFDYKLDIVVANYGASTVSVLKSNVVYNSINSFSFANKIDFAVGKQPNSVVILDFNLGYLDIATANFNDNSVSILTSKPNVNVINDTIYKLNTVAVGNNPYHLTTAYVNKTGHKQILCVNQNSVSMSVISNNFTKVDLQTGIFPRGVAINDFNGDDKVDWAVANFTANTISVFQNNTNTGNQITSSTVQAKVDFTVNTQPFALTTADLDLDGRPDIISISASTKSATILRNTRGASISFLQIPNKNITVNLNKSSSKSMIILKANRLNGSLLNIVSNNTALKIDTLENGSFSNSTLTLNNSLIDSVGTDTVWVQFNGNNTTQNIEAKITFSATGALSQIIPFSIQSGIPSIKSFSKTVAKFDDTLSLIGKNLGNNLAKTSIRLGTVNAPILSVNDSLIKFKMPHGIVSGAITLNINGYQINSESALYTTFDGGGSIDKNSYGSPIFYKTTGIVSNLTVSDFDNDGQTDVAVSNFDQGIALFKNVSKRNFIDTNTFAKKVNVGTVRSAYVNSADLDGDNKVDFLWLNNNALNMSLLKNETTTDTLLTDNFSSRIDLVNSKFPAYFQTVDIDLDGKNDIIAPLNGTALNNANGISVYKNLSTSSSLFDGNIFPKTTDILSPEYVNQTTTSDLNNDGFQDIIAFSTNKNALYFFINKGLSGTVNENSFMSPFQITISNSPSDVITYDINNDGKKDVFIASSGDDKVYVLPNNYVNGSEFSSSSFGTSFQLNAGVAPVALAIADVDGDASPELISANYVSNTVSVFKNNGKNGILNTGYFGAKIDFSTGKSPNDVAVVDVNNDDRPEILVANSAEKTFCLLTNKINPLQGIEKLETITFGMFPNPAQNEVLIQNPSTNAMEISISNITGEIVYSGNISEDNIKLNLDSWQKGLYIVTLKDNNKVGVQKLIIW
ncbi:MAG: hypothetical protein RLZZ175_66 [Bacteroidota bacterium]|jgi:hypothetical protein